MDKDPITGFIDRRQAGRQYNRSAKSLARDYEKAYHAADQAILKHFRLRTDDGQIREATDVSPDLVKQLQQQQKLNPVWYVRRSWLEKTYGRKSPAGRSQKNPGAGEREAGSSQQATVSSQLITVLKQELTTKNNQIEHQQKLLDRMSDQLNERLRESNVLMKQLQDGYLLPKDSQTALTVDSQPAPSDASSGSSSEPSPDEFPQHKAKLSWWENLKKQWSEAGND